MQPGLLLIPRQDRQRSQMAIADAIIQAYPCIPSTSNLQAAIKDVPKQGVQAVHPRDMPDFILRNAAALQASVRVDGLGISDVQMPPEQVLRHVNGGFLVRERVPLVTPVMAAHHDCELRAVQFMELVLVEVEVRGKDNAERALRVLLRRERAGDEVTKAIGHEADILIEQVDDHDVHRLVEGREQVANGLRVEIADATAML